MWSELNARTLPVAARGKRVAPSGKAAAAAGDETGRPCRRAEQPGTPVDEERIEAELDRVVGRGDK